MNSPRGPAVELHSLLLFIIACLSLNLIPGPDVIYIVSNTMTGKISGGLKAALGLGVGYFFHTFAACVGLSAIILSSTLAFTIVKWLGALYLLYLGIQALRSMRNGTSPLLINNNKTQDHNIFSQGVLVSILNPKVALFFLSFLPQFINPATGSAAMQLLLLGVIFSVLATFINILYATLGSWLFNRPDANKYSRILEGISGVLLIGLASKIAFSER
jgi:threonine/homoserine/homoserine lactone efflux protein